MSKKVLIVGAGINGLVAANYLARAGFAVTVLERKDVPGGACCAGKWMHERVEYEYPQGASVLGFMQDFVFEETGLSGKVQIHRPAHPEIVYTTTDAKPHLLDDAPEQWGERGEIAGFLKDMDRVASFLRKGYRDAAVPTLESARDALGPELVARWITGSARDLLDHYLASESLKLFYGVSVIESGPVSLDSPYSAFTIPLMASGSVFGGDWGYVRGGIWQIPIELDKLNKGLGVKAIFSARAVAFSSENMTMQYEKDGVLTAVAADYVIFATDPLSAARIVGEKELVRKVSEQKLLGTSGKLVMFLKNPVQWKHGTGREGFAAALRHIIPVKSLAESQNAMNLAAKGEAGFTPAYFEVYCEGAGDRELGGARDYDLVSVFFTPVAFSGKGEELPELKRKATEYVLAHILNPEDLVHTILETPKDLADLFFFPRGNIDHVELAEGQTFFERTYSPEPEKSFYQFGSDSRVFYCAAGAYPCGSVAGTPGYMCARHIIRLQLTVWTPPRIVVLRPRLS